MAQFKRAHLRDPAGQRVQAGPATAHGVLVQR
jgi:hypothetical protein